MYWQPHGTKVVGNMDDRISDVGVVEPKELVQKGPNGHEHLRHVVTAIRTPVMADVTYGRGYVQLTWKNNYERMSNFSKILVINTHNGVVYGDGKNGT